METQLYSKIDDLLEELRTELYQKASHWYRVRTPSGLFDLEQQLQATLNCFQSKIVGTVLETIHEDRVFVVECQKQALRQRHAYSEGWRKVPIRTLGGQQVNVRTPYSQVRSKVKIEHKGKKIYRKGVGIFPVLRRLGIVRHITPRFLAEINRQVVDGPSCIEAQERLVNREILCNQTFLWFHVRDFASIALSQRQKSLSNRYEKNFSESAFLAGKRVVIGLDGGRVRIRIDKKSNNPALSRKGFTTDKCEVKLFVIYVIDEKGKKIQEERITYDGTILPVDQIFALLKLRLTQMGITQAELLVVIGDGAPWIWKNIADLYSTLKLEGELPIYEIIDWAHTVGKLSKPAKIGITEGGQKQKWFRQARKLLKEDQVGEVIEALQNLDQSQDKEEEIRRAIEFFQIHQERMKYADFKTLGLPTGSGVIESAVRQIVNLRLKGACKFWHPENAEGVLYLRCQIKSRQWTTFVKSVLTEWAKDMSTSLVQALQIRSQIANRFLEFHPSVDIIGSRNEAIQWARDALKKGEFLLIDTETTGLKNDDEIIQLGIIDSHGNVLLETFVKPTKPISPDAYAVHGIAVQHLTNAPPFSELYSTIGELICKQALIAYNADFDQRILQQTCKKYRLPRLEGINWICAMEKYACFWGEHHGNNKFKKQSLIAACAQQGIPVINTHAAVGDCLLTLELMKAMANADETQDLKQKLSN